MSGAINSSEQHSCEWFVLPVLRRTLSREFSTNFTRFDYLGGWQLAPALESPARGAS
jgi:hypothetical protein